MGRQQAVWAGKLKLLILQRSHDSETAGHFGFVKTLRLVKRQFWWPGMKKDVEGYMAGCPVGATVKGPWGKLRGLLQQVDSPSPLWKEIPPSAALVCNCSTLLALFRWVSYLSPSGHFHT